MESAKKSKCKNGSSKKWAVAVKHGRYESGKCFGIIGIKIGGKDFDHIFLKWQSRRKGVMMCRTALNYFQLVFQFY